MAKHLKKLKVLFLSEEKAYYDIADGLKERGFPNCSRSYVSSRMRGEQDWTTEEMYAIGDMFDIPREELLDYFPPCRVYQTVKRLRVV